MEGVEQPQLHHHACVLRRTVRSRWSQRVRLLSHLTVTILFGADIARFWTSEAWNSQRCGIFLRAGQFHGLRHRASSITWVTIPRAPMNIFLMSQCLVGCVVPSLATKPCLGVLGLGRRELLRCSSS